MQQRTETCPDHGLVLAQRKTILVYMNLLLIVFSLGQMGLYPLFRCPKCGAITKEY